MEAALGRWLDARLEEAENSIPDGVRVFPAVMDDNLARPPLRRWQRERRRWETWCVRHGFGDSVVGWLDELIQRQEQHPRARTSAAYFLNAYLVVRDRGALREIAEELWRGHHRVEHPIELAPPHLITPGGDLADPGGGIAPVDRSEKESAERVRRGGEIRRLQSAVVEAGEQLAEAEKMRGTADRQCAQLRRELEELSEKEREVRGQLQLHRAEQDRRERERRRREDERRELEESSEQISELEKEKADIERQMLRSERAEAELSAHRRRTRKRLEPLESRLEEVESSLNEAEHGRISLRERIEGEQRRRRDLDREAERVDRQLHHWRSSLRDYADELEEAIRREADLSEREAAFDAAVERTDRQFRTVLERDQCAAETEEQLRARLDRLREDREELERDASRIEVQLARAQTRYEQVEREVREVGLDPESVGGQKDPPGERRLARMRRDLSRIEARRRELEPVNPLSIGEYRREARQLLGLQGQRDDISSALAGLRELSADARRQLDVRFKENLRATSSAFHRTFSDLFEGGQAELRLRGDSLWDGRVEMRVQPPGKKLTRLSLLSGGERALAGIAFLFALLNMRPAPICVFDEIDAALDEANTDRFARYVQRWRDEAQYLLITHQKQTMEIADAMHGVTMSEPGVSELVSVRLQGRDEPEVADAAAEGNGEGTT